MNEQQVTLAEITTSFGEKRQVTLPDGTLLVLNSCSQVRYPDRFVGDLREVELEGEGYFRVARNGKDAICCEDEATGCSGVRYPV